MGFEIILCVGLVLFLAVIQMEMGMALRSVVTPEHFKFDKESNVTVRCDLDKAEAAAKEIMTLKIAKEGEKAIVIIHPNNTITYRNSVKGRVQATGKIDESVGESYLQFVILDPRMEDRGTYSCHIYYMDQAGQLVDDKATDFLTVDDPQIKMMKDNVQKLIDWNEKTDKRIKALKEKTSPFIAFSATGNNHLLKPKKGQVMIFPDIIFQQGQGYDPTSGTFTAPRSGLYVFHLVLTTACRNCFIKAQIQSNNNVYSRLHAFNAEDSRQGSVSAVVKLYKGQTVSVYILDESDGVYLWFKRNCVFTGYLMKAVE